MGYAYQIHYMGFRGSALYGSRNVLTLKRRYGSVETLDQPFISPCFIRVVASIISTGQGCS